MNNIIEGKSCPINSLVKDGIIEKDLLIKRIETWNKCPKCVKDKIDKETCISNIKISWKIHYILKSEV